MLKTEKKITKRCKNFGKTFKFKILKYKKIIWTIIENLSSLNIWSDFWVLILGWIILVLEGLRK